MVWKKIPLVIGCLLAASVVFAAEEEDDDAATGKDPAYIGVEACGKCHKTAKKGDQLGQWEKTSHSKAFAVLGEAKAKEIAGKLKIADAQKDGKCLTCHATAHGVPAEKVVAPKPGKKGFVVEDGVQCEECHGPGSLYKSSKVMKDRDASIAAGMTVPDEKFCAKCHGSKDNAALVTAGHKPFDKFDFKEAWPKIEHPKPKAAE